MIQLPRVNVSFGAFDVVMEVISERVNQVDGIVPLVGTRVSRKEDKCDVTDVVAHCGVRPCMQTWMT